MTRRTRAIVAVLLAGGVALSANALAGSAATAEPAEPAIARAQPADTRHGQHRSFERFLETYEAANEAFINGDPSLWMSIVSDREPASIFGGFGGLGNAGVDDVLQRYQLAAGAFQDGGADLEVEYLVKDVRGRLAYTVARERAQVLYTGHTEPSEHFLRVTMIFRYERGEWKIVHRHADTMVDLVLPF
jgi:ketosteroid isomerase-like protein